MNKSHLPSSDFSSLRILIFSNGKDRLKSITNNLPFIPEQIDCFHKLDEVTRAIKEKRYNFAIADVSANEPVGKQLAIWLSVNYPYLPVYFLGETSHPSVNIDIWKITDTPVFRHINEGIDPLTVPLHILYSQDSHLRWMSVARCECLRVREQLAYSKSKTVLLMGVCGTGKAALAQIAHVNSDRVKGNFVFANCNFQEGRTPEIIWSDHRKNAFVTNIRHLMSIAQGGTLYFHDIEKLDKIAQSLLAEELKLIHKRIPGRKFPKVVICATKKDISDPVDAEEFSKDLLNEIGEKTMHLPPLSDFPKEIGAFATKLLQTYCIAERKDEMKFSKEALSAIVNHTFKENLRELFDIIKQAVVASPKHTIEETHLHFGVQSEGSSSIDAGHEYKAALIKTKGNVKKAAELCNISRDNFYDKMKLHDIPKGYGRKKK